jgi:GNAT superfamily N-acetyltransferase
MSRLNAPGVRLATIPPTATSRLFRSATEVLAAAFFDDPIFVFLAPDETVRQTLLALSFAAHLRLAAPEGHCDAAIDLDGTTAGVACYLPPGRVLPLRRLLPAIPDFVADGGPLLRSALSLVAGLRFLGAEKRLRPAEPHWYLMAVGVAPAAQGRGLGRLFVERGLDLARADGVPFALVTESERLVGFYEHIGLRVARDERPHPRGPRLWGLVSR